MVLPYSPSSLPLPTSPWASCHAQGLGIEETCLEVFPPLPSPPPSSQRQEMTPPHGRAQSLWFIPISHVFTLKGLNWILSPYM